MKVARLFLAFAICSFPLSSALSPTIAAAQGGAPLPCSEATNIVRVSEIKPGMMDKFLQAVAAQQAWYKKAGSPDKIEVMRVMKQDPSTKAWKLRDDEAITTHVQLSNSQLKHDAAWDAFVALFNESSTIKSTYFTCMASGTGKM